jgi:pimeloyl-ACP methyl ester carboxylesterase
VAIIFVHGVNTRQGPAYTATNLATEQFLRRHLAGAKIGAKMLGKSFSIRFPYWGNLATMFAWSGAALPQADMQTLGGPAEADLQPLIAHLRDSLVMPLGSEPLTTLARKDFSEAIDILVAIALQNTKQGDEAKTAKFVVEASAYAATNPVPPWLTEVGSDTQLISVLQDKVAGPACVEVLGSLGVPYNAITLASLKLKQGVLSLAGKAADRTGDFASTKLLAWARDPLNAVLGRFFGDVFIYLDSRGDKDRPGEIPNQILTAFADARRSAQSDEPFVVIGHSFGGVIAFDLLSHFTPETEVDLFVSVGSQVAHFEEIKLYKESDPRIQAPAKAKTPPNIRRWINVYDEVDIFAYAAQRVFDRVDVDGRYDTRTYTIKAHGAYFQQDRFYQRLRTRIDELNDPL